MDPQKAQTWILIDNIYSWTYLQLNLFTVELLQLTTIN